MNKKLLYVIIAIVIIVLLIAIVKISKNKDDTDMPTGQNNQNNVVDNSDVTNTHGKEIDTTETSELSTCIDLGGTICAVGIECPGDWIDASDTFDCCAVACDGDVLTIDTFDVNEENEDLGGLE